jgi:hypothetical protein
MASAWTDLKRAEKRQSFGFEIRWSKFWALRFRRQLESLWSISFWLIQIDRLGRKLKQSQMFKDIRRSRYVVALRHYFFLGADADVKVPA